MTSAFAIDDRIIAYDDSGDREGPVLVYSNSLGTDLRSWDAVLPFLPHCRHIRWDKPGHGLSDRAGDRPIEALADDLARLLDYLEVDYAVIVGLSVGGLIAQALWAAQPKRIEGLVLCDTAHRIGPEEMWNTRIAAIEEGGLDAIAEGVMQRWFSENFRKDRPAEVEMWRNAMTRAPAEGYTDICRAIRDADLTTAAASITVPTLCVVGEVDVATPPALVRSMADLIGGAEFRVIDRVGHLPCIEAPEVLADAIAAFMGDNEFV